MGLWDEIKDFFFVIQRKEQSKIKTGYTHVYQKYMYLQQLLHDKYFLQQNILV